MSPDLSRLIELRQRRTGHVIYGYEWRCGRWVNVGREVERLAPSSVPDWLVVGAKIVTAPRDQPHEVLEVSPLMVLVRHPSSALSWAVDTATIVRHWMVAQ